MSKKREPIGHQIDRLLNAGWECREIAAHLRCRLHYVQDIKSCGGYSARLVRTRDGARRRRGHRPREELRIRTAAAHAPIIAAVDAGMTYADAARVFGLKSRNCVAGIMSRRPEALQ